MSGIHGSRHTVLHADLMPSNHHCIRDTFVRYDTTRVYTGIAHVLKMSVCLFVCLSTGPPAFTARNDFFLFFFHFCFVNGLSATKLKSDQTD